MNRLLRLNALILCLFSLCACSTALTPSQERTAMGGAIGVAAGTVGTVVLGGCIPCGAALGGAVGAGTSYAIDQVKQATE